ncbi:MAG: hypothetical protein ABI315_00760 [Bacteroidia bacterium]
MTTLDSSSFHHLNQFNIKCYGWTPPIHDVTETAVFSKEGRYLKDVTPDSIYSTMFKSLEHPDYIHINCPVLAIYAVHKLAENLRPQLYKNLDAPKKKIFYEYLSWFISFNDAEMNRFKKALPNGKIKTIADADHYIFISNPVETEKMIRDFL